jgi:hypothetical protein
MAMRGYIYGKKAVVKESGGKPFLSSAVPWTDAPNLRPAGVVRRNEAFSRATVGCKTQSKSKHGTVWGISDYNKCIGRALGKLKKAV